MRETIDVAGNNHTALTLNGRYYRTINFNGAAVARIAGLVDTK